MNAKQKTPTDGMNKKMPGKHKKCITRGKGSCSCSDDSRTDQVPSHVTKRMFGAGGEARTVKQK